jgi:hypothetical protein
MKIYKAIFDSRNFSFEAYGETETLAIEHLKRGLNNHAKQYGLEKNWWHEYGGDICAYEIKIGTPAFNSCYRDNELILEKTNDK